MHRYCQGKVVPAEFGTVEGIALACGADRAEVDDLYALWCQANSGPPAPDPRPEPPARHPVAQAPGTGVRRRSAPRRHRRWAAVLCALFLVADWSVLDRLVDAAGRAPLPVLYTFGGTPGWAAPNAPPGPYGDGSRTAPPDDLADWDQFVRASRELCVRQQHRQDPARRTSRTGGSGTLGRRPRPDLHGIRALGRYGHGMPASLTPHRQGLALAMLATRRDEASTGSPS